MRKISSMLLLMMLFLSSSVWADHVTDIRTWDFTKGGDHADQVADCDYWTASSKGRYSLTKALDNQELPANNGGALSGLDGVYFTVLKEPSTASQPITASRTAP